MEPTELEIYHELRAACLAVFERHGISEEYIRFDMLLSRHQVRDAEIRATYNESGCPHGYLDSLRYQIAEKYGISESLVRKIVYS